MRMVKRIFFALKVMCHNAYTEIILRVIAIKYSELMREVEPLGVHLERDLFPELKSSGIKNVIIRLNVAQNSVICDSGLAEHEISGQKNFSNFLIDNGISSLVLDTKFEANQFIELVLILLYSQSFLSSDSNDNTGFWWSARSDIAAKMHSDEGFHKFCMNIHHDRDAKTITAEYTYCELFYSHIISNYLTGSGRNSDHRALFKLAPRAGLAVAVILVILFVLSMTDSVDILVIAIVISIFGGFFTWYTLYTIGSVRYDAEHREVLLEESSREQKALSHFPFINPNLIMKFNMQGELVFKNPATERFLKSVGKSEDDITEILPSNYLSMLCSCATGKSCPLECEVSIGGRTINYSFNHFSDSNEVFVAGSDVSRLKNLENDLREINAELEGRVIKRTEELRLTRDVTIMSLSNLAETRDPETGAHIERTSNYIKVLAGELCKRRKYTSILTTEHIDLLQRSAPLHDIGKVGIPDAILQKPGRLTEAEFEIMKMHAVYGGDALQNAEKKLGSNSFLRIAKEIAYTHHERWDGEGYPAGLKGEEIPLSGRLMALADVYDALISKRVYKEAFSHEKARGIILQDRSKHFDPAVVDAFLSVEVEFIDIAKKFTDEDK